MTLKEVYRKCSISSLKEIPPQNKAKVFSKKWYLKLLNKFVNNRGFLKITRFGRSKVTRIQEKSRQNKETKLINDIVFSMADM